MLKSSVLLYFVLALAFTAAKASKPRTNSRQQTRNPSKTHQIRTCIGFHTRMMCSVMFLTKQELQLKLIKLSKITKSTINIDVKIINFPPVFNTKIISDKPNNQNKTTENDGSEEGNSFLKHLPHTITTTSSLKTVLPMIAVLEPSPSLQKKSFFLAKPSGENIVAKNNSNSICNNPSYLIAALLILFIVSQLK